MDEITVTTTCKTTTTFVIWSETGNVLPAEKIKTVWTTGCHCCCYLIEFSDDYKWTWAMYNCADNKLYGANGRNPREQLVSNIPEGGACFFCATPISQITAALFAVMPDDKKK